MWTLARGKPARLTVTLLHGVVLAQSAFEHSANYQRSSRLVASSRSMTLTNDSHPDRIMGSQPSASQPCHVDGFSHLSAGSQPRLRLVPLTLQPPAITDGSVRRKPDNLYSRRRQILSVNRAQWGVSRGTGVIGHGQRVGVREGLEPLCL